ncbi:cellulose binding domain-containing protein [Spirillospora sp. NPDC052269]
MSGDSPGYVPPDHTSTAEFAIPKRRSAAAGPPPDDTLIDTPPAGDPLPADDLPPVDKDLPTDDVPPADAFPPADDLLSARADLPVDDVPPDAYDASPEETITDVPAPAATLTDVPEVAAVLRSSEPVDDPEPEPAPTRMPAPVTITDIPIPRRDDRDSTPFGAPTPIETAPSVPAEAPAPDVTPHEDNWTAFFGAEAEGRAEGSAAAPQTHEPSAPTSAPPAGIPPEQPTPPVGNPSDEAVVALGAEGIPPAPATPAPPYALSRPAAAPPSPSSTGPHTGDLSVAGGTPPTGSKAAFGIPPTAPAGGTAPSGGQGPVGGPGGRGGSGIGGATAPTGMPTPGMPTPGMPTPGMPTPGPARQKRSPWVLVALAVGVLFVLGGVAAAMLLGGSSGGKRSASAPESSATASIEPTSSPSAPSSGEPSHEPSGSAPPSTQPSGEPSEGPAGTPGAVPPPAGGTPPAGGGRPSAPPGPVKQGNGITYQIVQQSQGYFEGQFVVTNPGTAPLTGWKITFDTPRADVHTIWGAELVHGGTHVEIDGTVAIPPGGSWTVRFGATGLPAAPQGCQLAGRACGF